MEKNKTQFGRAGEELACKYLKRRGYKILEQNFRTKGSEIDIIARRGKFLVFCEVKTRKTLAFGTPAEAVDEKKISHLLCGAQKYIYENEALCKSGVYALCRHPVAVCFLLTYLFLGLSALPSVLLLNGMTFSILNILYVLFQDIVTFPVTIKGYNEYKKEVPFLIPNKKSIRLAFETLKRQNRKEVK
jgi:putative endonuclease